MISTYFNFDYVLKEILEDNRKMIRFHEWHPNHRGMIFNDEFYLFYCYFENNEWIFLSAGKMEFKPSEMNKYGWEVMLPYNKDYQEFKNVTFKESL